MSHNLTHVIPVLGNEKQYIIIVVDYNPITREVLEIVSITLKEDTKEEINIIEAIDTIADAIGVNKSYETVVGNIDWHEVYIDYVRD